jgi:hypothetical protein
MLNDIWATYWYLLNLNKSLLAFLAAGLFAEMFFVFLFFLLKHSFFEMKS